jgi:hypothetical protein
MIRGVRHDQGMKSQSRVTTVGVVAVIVVLGGVVAWGIWSSIVELSGWTDDDVAWLARSFALLGCAAAVAILVVVARGSLRYDRVARRVLRREVATAVVLPLEWIERDESPRLYSFSAVTVTDSEIALWIPSRPPRRIRTASPAEVVDIQVVADRRAPCVRVGLLLGGAPVMVSLRFRRRYLEDARRAVTLVDALRRPRTDA